MELQYFGGDCLKIAAKKATLTIDDNLDTLGAKNITKDNDIALFTANAPEKFAARMMIDQPGEYEVSDVAIAGIAARSYGADKDDKSATIFKITSEDISLVVVGHIHPDLSDTQLEALGHVDVLFIPVGGNQVTLDSQEALKLIKEIEPKMVIPVYFDDKGLKYSAKVEDLQTAIKGLAMEAGDTTAKLKIKPGEIQEGTRLIVLERQRN